MILRIFEVKENYLPNVKAIKMMKAIEVGGHIDKMGELKIDAPLKVSNKRVKVIILVPEEEDEIEDSYWLQAVLSNPAFDFLEEEEEIYSSTDGEPMTDEV